MSHQVGRRLRWLFLFSLLASNGVQAASQLSLQQIFKDNAPAVVFIEVVDNAGNRRGNASGFVVSPSGVILTNHHVIEPEPGVRLIIRLANGDKYDDIWVIHDDEQRDFAVLAIKAASLPSVRLGDSETVQVGEQVVTIGNPLGLEQTFTVGIVSSVRLDPDQGYRIIQHQTPTSPGSSGGPLLNMTGEVIGIHKGAFSLEGAKAENLNVAIPINYAKPYLQDPPKMRYAEYARSRGVALPEPKKSAAPPPEVWKIYHNERYQVSFKYPASWEFEKEATGVFELLSVSWKASFDETTKEEEEAARPVGFLLKKVSYVFFHMKVREPQMQEQPKEGEQLNLEQLAKSSQQGEARRTSESWEDSRTLSTEFFHGDGFAGYRWDYEFREFDLAVQFKILTKSTVYLLEGRCMTVSEEELGSVRFNYRRSYCTSTFEGIFKSFVFPR